MSRPALLLLCLVLAAGAPDAAPPGGEPDPVRERLRKMTRPQLEDELKWLKGRAPREAVARVGRPDRVARQVFYQGYLEQWLYEGVLRIEFACQFGKEPRAHSVHLLITGK